MKAFFTTIILFISISTYSQWETTISDGDFTKLQTAVANDTISTITIKGLNIVFSSNLDIPYNKTLRFFNGAKLETNNKVVNIKSDIDAKLFQIFKVPENHNLKIYNQEVYPEWFGICHHQDNTENNDVSIINKTKKSIENGGTINFKGTEYIINQNLDFGSNFTLVFKHQSMLSINPTSTVNIKGNVDAKLFQIFEVPENHNLKIYNQEIYPEWFGVCSYQNDSSVGDSEIIQKAANSLIYGGVIIFNGKRYLIDKSIIINESAVKIKGKGTYTSSTYSNNLEVINDSTSNIFNIKKSGVRILDLNFKGYKDPTRPSNYYTKGSNTVNRALFFKKENSKDIDASVSNCIFSYFKECIFVEGSNLKVTDNLFSTSYIGINIKMSNYIDYDRDNDRIPDSRDTNIISTGNNDDPIIVNNPAVRGFIIDRNRFHSIGSYNKSNTLIGSTCIKIRIHPGFPNPESPFYSYYGGSIYRARGHKNKISNNYADDCKTFFDGSIDRTSIENNTIVTCGGTAIKASGLYGAITNNYIDGSWTWSANKRIYCPNGCSNNDLDTFPNGSGIEINYAHFTTIHNNQIHNVRFHGIHLKHSKNSSIQSNTIMNFNRLSTDSHNNITPDYAKYDGIHIDNTDNYNIQNIVSNNTISMTIKGLKAKSGIYIGDGDLMNFVRDNFILPTKLVKKEINLKAVITKKNVTPRNSIIKSIKHEMEILENSGNTTNNYSYTWSIVNSTNDLNVSVVGSTTSSVFNVQFVRPNVPPYEASYLVKCIMTNLEDLDSSHHNAITTNKRFYF